MKKILALVLCVAMLLTMTFAMAEGKNPEDYTGALVVYSPHDANPLNAGVGMFMEKYPNIDVQVIAAGTGELCQRVVAESANPQGDVLWGGGADTLAAYVDYFAPYQCANDDVIADSFKAADDLWIGESPFLWFSSTTRPCWLRKTFLLPGKTCAMKN